MCGSNYSPNRVFRRGRIIPWGKYGEINALLAKRFFPPSKTSQVHRLQLQNTLTNYEWLRLIRESRRKPSERITANAWILNHQGWQFSRQEQLMDHMLHLDHFLLVTVAFWWCLLKQTQNLNRVIGQNVEHDRASVIRQVCIRVILAAIHVE